MVIKASSAGEIRQLVDALHGGDAVRREAAVARLSVIGPRAVDHLLKAYTAATSPVTQAAIMRALDPIADPRTLPIARAAIRSPGETAIAGAGALRSLLTHHDAQTAADALDALLTATSDSELPASVRSAADEALADLPEDIRTRLRAARTAADGGPDADAVEALAARDVWTDALEGRLPDSPAALRAAIAGHAAASPLTGLQKLVDRIREAESAAASAAEWQIARGALHQALAQRGSRVALYDLRETLTAAVGPLPVSFLAALHAIGDASCLQPIAEAFDRAPSGNDWWTQQLAAAFRAIVRREKLTRRSALLKRIAARHPRIVAADAPG